MHTTAIMNFKGGTGKTVTTVNLAAELAARGKRVVVIDADPQCNLTEFYGVEPREGFTLYDYLTSGGAAEYVKYIEPAADNVFVIPASMDLILADVRALSENAVERTKLRRMAEDMTEDDFADYCLIDCPAYLSAASSAALIAANDVILPIRVDSFALSGMEKILKQIAGMRAYNPRLRIAGALVTMDRNTTIISREAKAALRQSAVPVFGATIPFTEAVTQSISMHDPLREMRTRYARLAAAAYAAVTDEYLEGGAKYGEV